MVRRLVTRALCGVFVLFQMTGQMAGAVEAKTPADPVDASELGRLYSPEIHGDVLYIKGRIDSHIYDYLSYEQTAMKSVKVVELNSLGGKGEWALEIAQKLKTLGLTTRLSSGHYCASACAYLFAAGRDREAARDTWIGVHGARLGAGYATTFQGLCFVDMEDGPVFEPRKKDCQEFLNRWYAAAFELTQKAFDFMEANGVNPSLRDTYYAMPDDPQWYEALNVIRKPDWPIDAADALQYRLVTKIVD